MLNGISIGKIIFTGRDHTLPLIFSKIILFRRKKRKLYIGGIFPMSGHKYVAPELAIGLSKLISKRNQNKFCTISVARMAVDDVNSNTSMLANYELSLDIKDGKCEPDVVMKMFIDIIRTKALSRFSSTVGVLGPACSNTVEAIAGVSKHYRTVVVTYRFGAWCNFCD